MSINGRVVLIDGAASNESVSLLVSGRSGPAGLEQELADLDIFPVSMAAVDSASCDSAALLAAFWPLSEKVENLFRAVAARRIPRLVVIDQAIEFSEMRPLPADRVACIGRAQARQLTACGNSCEAVGVAAIDRLPRTDSSSDGPSGKRRIVIWHSGRGAASKSLCAWADINRGHGRYAVDVLFEPGEESLKKLAGADACLTDDPNRLLVSMTLGIPTALARYSTGPEPIQAAWRIASGRDIDGAVREALSPQPARMLFQDTSLHLSLEARTPATPRLQCLIEEMVRPPREPRGAGNRQTDGRFTAFVAGQPMDREQRFRHEVLFEYPRWCSGDEAELRGLCERHIRCARPYESQPLSPEAIAVTMRCSRGTFQVRPGAFLMMETSISNRSGVPLTSAGSCPVYASYHWKDESGRTVVHDGVRTQVHVPAGCDKEVAIKVFAPRDAGQYELVLTLVAEGRFWFDASPPNVRCTCWVMVME